MQTELFFNDVISATTAELNRAGWTVDQGRQYLLETYGKRSRHLLTDDELLEFWEYLKKLPNSYKEGACIVCGSGNVEDKLTPDKVHYGQRICLDCGYKGHWLPKPHPEKVAQKHKNLSLLKGIKKGFCHICLRQELELPGRVVLEAHHLIPASEGGTDDANNLLEVCSDCHKDIHHNQRRYKPYREANLKN